MLMSGREARQELERWGVSPWRARRAVELGLAGDAVVTRGALLYDADVVRELAARPLVSPGLMRSVAPEGYLVTQIDLHARSPLEELLAEARALPRSMSSLNAALLFVRPGGRMPLVVTIAGFVVACADAVGWDADGLELRPAGRWSRRVLHAQLPTGRGRGWTSQEPWKWRGKLAA
jgi:hypothetical protein